MNSREALAVTCARCGRPATGPAPLGMCPGCLADDVRTAGEEAVRLLPPGTRFRDFEIGGVLGRGGMGVVYRARQLSLGRDVALKFLSPELSASPRFVERFEREAKSLAQLNHPNTVHVYDFGRDGTNLFLAMEYVEGPSLARLIQEGLGHQRLKRILSDVAAGLRGIHEAGLVHRDIKPSNILIGKDGAARISDFGLALEAEGDSRLTDSGVFVGSPAYASPEAVRHGALDRRSDLYSLGVVMYEALAGRLPFAAPFHAELLMKHVREAPPLGPLPAAWRPLVARLLAKDPAHRPASATDLIADLARVPEARRVGRRAGLKIALGAALVAALVAAGSLALRRPPERVDLLALVDLDLDAVVGMGAMEGGAISAREHFQLMIPYAPPEEYDFSFTARKLGEGMSIQPVLVCGGRQVVVVVDGWGGRTGFSNLDGRWGMANDSTYTGRLVADAESHRYEFSVRRGSISFRFDGRTVIDWRGDPARLGLTHTARLPHSGALGLGLSPAWRVDRIELTPIAGAGQPLPHPAIDLLASVDPSRDAVEGSWALAAGVLSCATSGPQDRIQLPYAPPPEYALQILAEPVGPETPFTIGLVRDGKRVLVVVEDSVKNLTRGRIEGVPKASSKVGLAEFDQKGPRRITCTQIKEAFHVTMNGRRIAYSGPEGLKSAAEGVLPIPDPRAPFIACGPGWRIRELKIIPYFEPGVPLR